MTNPVIGYAMVNRATSSIDGLYSVPRRFDLATIMVVTIAYALLFVVMRLAQLSPIVFVLIAGTITSVGIGQALLFGGKNPRLSSVLAGIACIFGYGVFANIAVGSLRPGSLVILLIWSLIAGTSLGYVAGVAVGSVFLMTDMMRKSIQRFKRRP